MLSIRVTRLKGVLTHAIRKNCRQTGDRRVRKTLIVEGIHNALVQAIGMPEDELFNLVSEYNANDFVYSRTFIGVARSDHLVVVEITMRRGRSDAMKKALYAEIAANLEKLAGISSKDVYIFVHENDYSDWSIGNGQFAMVLAQQRGSDL
jgi:phenylpyruvate tautomerase PptA (4-oxalocrotonate tautomerase family)